MNLIETLEKLEPEMRKILTTEDLQKYREVVMMVKEYFYLKGE